MVTEARETGSLIGSDKVEGTAVYGADDTKIGSIERVMIDKMSGRVSYAVLSFGGFLGIGDDHYPLPWQSLKYDTNLGGYSTGVSENQLKGAPKIATTIPGTGLTRPGPGQSMTIMELRSENIGPGKPGLSFQLTALLRTGRLGSR